MAQFKGLDFLFPISRGAKTAIPSGGTGWDLAGQVAGAAGGAAGEGSALGAMGSGAGTGAGIGSMIMPGLGTAIGAAAGAGLGGLKHLLVDLPEEKRTKKIRQAEILLRPYTGQKVETQVKPANLLKDLTSGGLSGADFAGGLSDKAEFQKLIAANTAKSQAEADLIAAAARAKGGPAAAPAKGRGPASSKGGWDATAEAGPGRIDESLDPKTMLPFAVSALTGGDTVKGLTGQGIQVEGPFPEEKFTRVGSNTQGLTREEFLARQRRGRR